jgi:hypothetical protein
LEGGGNESLATALIALVCEVLFQRWIYQHGERRASSVAEERVGREKGEIKSGEEEQQRQEPRNFRKR